ncbi:sensor domain-containing diguanylate cyclase [Panacagrimonas perspica]|nr:PAS domain S-box protein [Panacagrimonas perspica]
MKLLPTFSTRSAPTLTAPEPVHEVSQGRFERAVDRAYREMVEERPRSDVLRNLCQGIADSHGLPLVALLRRHDGGALEIEATSRETLLWAELTRLPERCDGTIVGNGPGSRALQTRETVAVNVDEPGFSPWREAAMRDGIVRVCARPLEFEEPGWVLMLCASRLSPAWACDEDDALLVAAACARVIAASRLLARRTLLATALSGAGNAAFIADIEGRITWCNASFCDLTGYSREDVIGRNPRFLSSGRHGVRHYRGLWNTIRSGEIWRGETVDRDRSGAAFTANQTISPFGTEGRVTHYLAVYDDVSRKKAEEVRRELCSTRDALTGLMHRAALEHCLSERLSRRQPVSIGVIAARRLAAIEGLGGDAFETFQSEIQSRLLETLGAERAARMSAGEYLVDLPEDAENADRLVETLMHDLREPYPLIGEISGIDLRIGRARSPADGDTVEALLLAADRSLGAEPMAPARRYMEMQAD